MHFTSSNLLHDFPNDKNMLFSLYIKKIHAKNTTWPDPTCNSIDSNPYLTHLKWPVFDPQLVWLATWLTRPDPPVLPCLPIQLATFNGKITPEHCFYNLQPTLFPQQSIDGTRILARICSGPSERVGCNPNNYKGRKLPQKSGSVNKERKREREREKIIIEPRNINQ